MLCCVSRKSQQYVNLVEGKAFAKGASLLMELKLKLVIRLKFMKTRPH